MRVPLKSGEASACALEERIWSKEESVNVCSLQENASIIWSIMKDKKHIKSICLLGTVMLYRAKLSLSRFRAYGFLLLICRRAKHQPVLQGGAIRFLWDFSPPHLSLNLWKCNVNWTVYSKTHPDRQAVHLKSVLWYIVLWSCLPDHVALGPTSTCE